MIRIPCPCCGLRDYTEFTYEGDATRKRPAYGEEASADEWNEYVHNRTNPVEAHSEYWQHSGGCRQWLIVNRDMKTHEIFYVKFASEAQA